MRAQLVPANGKKPYTITRDVTLVGRQPNLCDLVIPRGSISKLHCVIVRTDGLLFIRDLGSTNGTRVNGQKVLRGALLPGDELSFASERFRVEMGPGEPDEEVPLDAPTEAITSFEAGELGLRQSFEAEDAEDEEAASSSDVRLLPDED